MEGDVVRGEQRRRGEQLKTSEAERWRRMNEEWWRRRFTGRLKVCLVRYKNAVYTWPATGTTHTHVWTKQTHGNKKPQHKVVVALNENQSAIRWDQWDERGWEREAGKEERCIVEVLIDQYICLLSSLMISAQRQRGEQTHSHTRQP